MGQVDWPKDAIIEKLVEEGAPKTKPRYTLTLTWSTERRLKTSISSG